MTSAMFGKQEERESEPIRLKALKRLWAVDIARRDTSVARTDAKTASSWNKLEREAHVRFE